MEGQLEEFVEPLELDEEDELLELLDEVLVLLPSFFAPPEEPPLDDPPEGFRL